MSESIFELLRKRYEPPAWAFLEEVRNGTGYGRVTRTADALAMSLYPSRGLHLHGFEVKVSRPDWVKELRDPDKAEEIAKFCHFWWLAIGDAGIVKNGEVPATWGLLVSDGKKLKVEREPTLNAEAKAPTHAFLGAILRKFSATSTDHARIERAIQEGRDAGWKAAREQSEKHAQAATDAYKFPYDRLVAKVREFQEASGIDILGAYQYGKIAATVRLLSGGWDAPAGALERLASEARDIAARADEALAEVKARLTPPTRDRGMAGKTGDAT